MISKRRVTALEDIYIGKCTVDSCFAARKPIDASQSRLTDGSRCGEGAPVEGITARLPVDRTGQGNAIGKDKGICAAATEEIRRPIRVDVEAVPVLSTEVNFYLGAEAQAVKAGCDRSRRSIENEVQAGGNRREVQRIGSRGIYNCVDAEAIEEDIRIIPAAAIEQVIETIAGQDIISTTREDVLNMN